MEALHKTGSVRLLLSGEVHSMENIGLVERRRCKAVRHEARVRYAVAKTPSRVISIPAHIECQQSRLWTASQSFVPVSRAQAVDHGKIFPFSPPVALKSANSPLRNAVIGSDLSSQCRYNYAKTPLPSLPRPITPLKTSPPPLWSPSLPPMLIPVPPIKVIARIPAEEGVAAAAAPHDTIVTSPKQSVTLTVLTVSSRAVVA